jgi:lysophospholipase L1-like esterase
MNTTTKKAANSIVGKLTALILSIGAAFFLTFSGPVRAQGGGESVLVVGDSLQVGTGPYLEQELGALPVEFDHRTGRGSAEGVSTLGSRLRPEHTIVIFDLGTNDDPRNPDALYSDMTAARQIAAGRCLVVATILRPPYNGVSVDGMNAAVERFALDNRGVQLVDWYGIATSTPGILYEDGVHARPEGYALRGRLLADAVAACAGGAAGGASGIPAPSGGETAPPPLPKPEPEPPAEVELDVPMPAPLLAIEEAILDAASLVSAAGRDARQAAGLGPPEPVLGAVKNSSP